VGGEIAVAGLRAHPLVDEVRSLTGESPADEDLVRLEDKVKTVLLDGRSVLLLERVGNRAGDVQWRTCPRQLLKNY
jgi:hypothetical protein